MTDPTPTPTPLSPAKHVLKRMYEINMDFNGRNAALAAAALRAAAPQMEFVPDVLRLHAIVAELEGQVDA